MDYKTIELNDIKEIAPFFQYAPWRTCDFTIGGMFMWRDYYKMEYCINNDSFFSRLRDSSDNYYYNLPLSSNLESSLKEFFENNASSDGTIQFCTVPEECLSFLSEHYNVVSSVDETDFADYLYLSESLTTLSGRKLSGHRNLIHQFEKNSPDWSFVPISSNCIDDIKRFFKDVYRVSSHASSYELEENKKVLEVLNNYDLYNFIGGALLENEEIIGFSIGEILRDTIYIHIEKSIRDKKGAYQMLTNQFLKHFCTERIRYVNREEDMGDEGLRRAKNAYYPERMLKKYTVKVQL